MPISTNNANYPISVDALGTAAKMYLLEKGLSNLNGITSTSIDGVRLFREPEGRHKHPLLYQSGIIIMLQGTKCLYVNDREIEYKKGDYIVFGVPLPAQCSATPDTDDCILGLVIDVPPSLLTELNQWREAPSILPSTPMFTVSQQSMSQSLLDVTLRLIDVLSNTHKANILGNNFIREIIYHIVNGPAGHILCGLSENGHYARIAAALRIIHDNYATRLNVDSLAQQVNMSVSGFHTAFRNVVLDSPIQYIKKFRLSKAKELIASGYRVGDAADAVGYKSLSQFSREFKRYYNFSPAKDRQTMT